MIKGTAIVIPVCCHIIFSFDPYENFVKCWSSSRCPAKSRAGGPVSCGDVCSGLASGTSLFNLSRVKYHPLYSG